MTAIPPLVFTYDGEAMIPKVPRLADRHLVVGELYRMSVEEERSMASHRQYFAALHDLWLNLPEDVAENFPSEEHLRKRALIEAHYYDEEIIDCGSNKVAPNIAAAIRKRDDFALIFVRDQFVIIRTAKSQSLKAMGKKLFQQSKQDVLDIVSAMVGSKPPVQEIAA
jgi:hypothetical protein